ncbi:hypothetical protein N0V90_008627 [Kalmusia sp. IMI 367209]|nr:hypothetical protein N0V90_008627 [Kalmusia sp. IMI 367209]
MVDVHSIFDKKSSTAPKRKAALPTPKNSKTLRGRALDGKTVPTDTPAKKGSGGGVGGVQRPSTFNVQTIHSVGQRKRKVDDAAPSEEDRDDLHDATFEPELGDEVHAEGRELETPKRMLRPRRAKKARSDEVEQENASATEGKKTTVDHSMATQGYVRRFGIGRVLGANTSIPAHPAHTNNH